MVSRVSNLAQARAFGAIMIGFGKPFPAYEVLCYPIPYFFQPILRNRRYVLLLQEISLLLTAEDINLVDSITPWRSEPDLVPQIE